MPINAALADRAVSRAIDLLRYRSGALRRVIAALNREDARLAAALAEALLALDRGSFTVERMEAQLASLRAVNARAYASLEQALATELQGVAGSEANATRASLASLTPAPVQLHFPIAGITAEQAYAAAMARPFQGRLLRDWARSLEAGRLALVRNAVRTGIVQGQTTAEIVQRVRGTRAAAYADGLLQISRREAATIVQTAIAHVAQRARAEVYKANADLVKAVQWVATLDNRTTPECGARDGHLYGATEHEPLDGGPPWLGGPGALHFNCRSVDVPVLKSWRELGIPVDELSPETRASMDGQVPAETTYGEWLGRQSAARQDEILGPTRGAMLRSGKATFDTFVDDKGKLLTLDELSARAGG